ncbi:MAG: HD-GYP domain-containing protein [Actinomycetota bacterium]
MEANKEQLSIEDVIQSLCIAIESKDHFTQGHSIRVADYCVEMAKTISLDDDYKETLYRAAMLHDIGQIAIEEKIMHKPGKLTQAELLIIQKHPLTAVKILEPLHLPEELLQIIIHHHEWWNGRGYPDGLSMTSISLGARVLAVADAFDAMTSQRPYRAKMPIPKALDHLEDGAGHQWDPDLVRVFLNFERAVLKKQSNSVGMVRMWRRYGL